MKKLVANRYQQAVKEIKELDIDQVSKIKEHINRSDKDHYHVALVKITDRPGQAKNKVTTSVQKFNKQGFDKIEKGFVFQGFSKLIVVHDPSIPSEDDEDGEDEGKVLNIDTTNAPVKTQAEIDAEIEQKAEAKFQEHLKSLEGKKEGDITKDETDESKKDLFYFGDTVKEMEEFAKKHEIDLSGLRLKEEIKAVLLTWKKEQEKQ